MRRRRNGLTTNRAAFAAAATALAVLLPGACLVVATPAPVYAAGATWDGGGGTAFWDNALNWAGDTLPSAGSDVSNATAQAITYRSLSGTTGINSFTGGGAFSVTGGTLNVATSFTTAGALTLSGGVLSVGGNLTASSIALAGGTLRGATIADASLLTFNASTSGNVLDGVTLGGNLTVGSGLVSQANVRFANTVAFTGAAPTITLNNSARLLLDGSAGALDNVTVNAGTSTGTIGFGSGQNANTALTLGPNLTVQGKNFFLGINAVNSGQNLVNHADLVSDEGGQWLLNAGNINNTGTLRASGSTSTLVVGSGTTQSFTNTGTLRAENGASVRVAANSADLGSVQASGAGSLVQLVGAYGAGSLANASVSNGGRINLEGTLSNAGTTLDMAGIVGAGGANGTFLLNGGAITGGSIANSGLLSFADATANQLIGVALDGGLNIGTGAASGQVRIGGGTTFGAGATVNLTGGGRLRVDADQGALDNIALNAVGSSLGQVIFGQGHSAATALTLGANLSVQGQSYLFGLSNGSAGVNVVNNTVLASDEGGTWSITAPVVTNNGTLRAAGNNARLNVNADSITNSSTGLIEVNGAGAQITLGNSGATLTNNGTLRASNGATLTLGNAAVLGNVQAVGTGATVNLGGAYTTSGTSTVTATGGGIINLTGTLNNAGSALDLSGIGSGGTFRMDGGKISGGTLNRADLLTLTLNNASVLDGVQVNGGLKIGTTAAPASLRLAGGTTIADGSAITLDGGGRLYLDAGQGGLDNATVNVVGNTVGTLGFGQGHGAGTDMTLGSGLNVQGKNLIVGSNASFGSNGSTLTNKAALVSDEGGNWQIGATNVANQGTITAASGSTANVTAGALNNSGTLRAAGANSTLGLNLSGASVNSGVMEAISGGTVNVINPTDGATLTNAGGAVTVGAGSVLSVGAGGLAQTSGQTLVNGDLRLASGAGTFQVMGGTIGGTGTLTGNLSLASGATLAPGNSPGLFSVTGNLTLGAGSLLLLEVNGTTPGLFDMLNVGGTASLGGDLRILLGSGFDPAAGETFSFLNAGSVIGGFSNVTVDREGYTAAFVPSGGGGTLRIAPSVAGSVVPEAGTGVLVTVAGMFGVAGVVLRRRRVALTAVRTLTPAA